MNQRSPQSTSGKSKLCLAALRSSLWLHGWPDRVKNTGPTTSYTLSSWYIIASTPSFVVFVCSCRIQMPPWHSLLLCCNSTTHTWLVEYRHWLIRWRLAYKLLYHSCLVHRARFGLQAQLSAWEDAQWLIYFLWGSRKPHWPGSACTFLNASQCSLSHFSTPCESTPSSLLLGQRRLTAKRVPLWESSLVLEAVSQPPFEF